MAPPTARRLQTVVAAGLAVALCWAGLTFRPRRSPVGAWPTIEGATFPLRVRAGDGTDFTLASPPQRVVLASATVVDFAAALIPGERVAALCAHAFTASALAFEPTLWRQIPAHERFTAELVLACRPDLVLCHDYNDQQTALALHKAGVPTLVLPGPQSFAECKRSLTVLGTLLGAHATATALVADLDRRAQALQERVPAGTPRRGLCFTHNPTGSWTGGARTLHDEALRLAGLANAAASAGIDGHAPIGIEQILALDPDLLVVDAPVGGGQGSLSFLRANKTLAGLRALAQGHVVELHPALYATGSHHVLAAAEAIAQGAAKLAPEVRR